MSGEGERQAAIIGTVTITGTVTCNIYRIGGGKEQQLCQWDRESSFKRNKRLSRDLPNIKVDWKARGILDKENSNDNFIIKISVVKF